jgi:hypothetical protein
MSSHPCSEDLPCPLCAERGTTSPFARDATREYLICARCDLVFVPPSSHPPADEEKKRYDTHRNDPADPGYRTFLSKLVDPLKAKLPPAGEGVDFGCGATAVLALMLEESGFRMRRYDPFYAPDPSVLEQTYDFIACSEAIEHFFRPAREWDLFLRLVRPGGWLGIMTLLREPDIDFSRWWYRNDFTHVAFYSRRTFEWLARRDGLDLEFYGQSVALLRAPLIRKAAGSGA